MERFDVDAFKVFDKQWALVSAGTPEDYNTMTISWGSVGTLWRKPIVNIYIRPTRFTFPLLEANDYFTIAFFPEQYHEDLSYLGTHSGRDGDKLAMTKLHAKVLEHGIGFEEASETLVCRKLFWQDYQLDNMPQELIRDFYSNADGLTRMYVAEVVDIL